VWARATMALVLAAAAGLAGCNVVAYPHAMRGRFIGKADAQDVKAFDAAVGLVSQLEYGSAAAEFSRLFPRLHAAGDQSRAAEAMFWLGYCHEKQQHRDIAAQWYRRVVRVYVWAPAASQALTRLSRLEQSPAPTPATAPAS